MGKIKVATLGSADEELLKEKARIKREEKKKREQAKETKESSAKSPATPTKQDKEAEKNEKSAVKDVSKETNKEKKKKFQIRLRGKKYLDLRMKVDKNKLYELDDAIKLLRDVTFTKFDATVELHINTTESGLRGSVKLPHGSGKEIKVEIADSKSIDKILSQVEKGQINFDVLVAHPEIMGKLAKVARVLGPKGLMPNPKAGTVSPTPEKIAEKFKGGEMNWKTESSFPIIHQRIGKMSFKDNQLMDNIKSIIKSIGETKIKSATLKSTMSPGIKLKLQ
jgi:large subunit ribosomal protein L1